MPKLSDLSVPRAQLIRECQRLNFGRIERLEVRGGEPVSDPPPSIVREIKFGGVNESRDEAALDDFELRQEAVALIESLDAIRDGVIDVLVVKHGMPFTMHVAESNFCVVA